MQVSLLQHWRETFKRFAPDMTIHVHSSGATDNSTAAAVAADVVIITASMMLQQRCAFLRERKYWRIIIDEAHLLANPSTLIYQTLSSLCSAHVWCVTGTPLQKCNGDDLRAMLRLCGVRWAMLSRKESNDVATGWRSFCCCRCCCCSQYS
jgi:SNF2 family DNA or RNA helicase